MAIFFSRIYELSGLFDIKMPKLDGVSALRIIKKINPDVRVIIFSGNSSYHEMQDALDFGASVCLAKPFQIRDLKLCLTALMSEE
ncbi:MAG: response regulator [Nitrospirota bacterium]